MVQGSLRLSSICFNCSTNIFQTDTLNKKRTFIYQLCIRNENELMFIAVRIGNIYLYIYTLGEYLEVCKKCIYNIKYMMHLPEQTIWPFQGWF